MSSLSSLEQSELADDRSDPLWRNRVAGGQPAIVAEVSKPEVYNLSLKVGADLMRQMNRLATANDEHVAEWVRRTLIAVVADATGDDPKMLRAGLSTPRRHRGAVPRR